MLKKQLVILIISSGLLACASSSKAPGRAESDAGSGRPDCISRSSVRGYNVLDEANLIVSASGRRKYHVTLRRRAYGLRSSWGIRFTTSTGRICAPFDAVIFEGHLDNESIRIASIRKLNSDEHEAILIQYGKKKPEIEQTPAPRDVKGAEVEELDPAANDDSSGD